MPVKDNKPKIVNLSTEEYNALVERVKSSNLSTNDFSLIVKCLNFMLWLQSKLSHASITITKLRQLFGMGKSKRKKSINKDDEKNANTDCPESSVDAAQDKPSEPENNQSTNSVGHGRLGADDYDGAEIVTLPHPTLKPGDLCPELCGGKLYNIFPGVVIKITGQGFAKTTRFEREKLRCALCGIIFTAALPDNIPNEKYDARFKAELAMQKYFMGSPFYRISQLQQAVGIPLPSATQWELVEQIANSVYPVFYALESIAAQSELLHYDDTRVKILSVIKENCDNPDKKRTGTYTTTIIGKTKDNHSITLYYSGKNHAGENIDNVLSKRDVTLPPIITMSDALAANIPSALRSILCNCLSHGIRKFTEIEMFFPQECQYIINALATVYKNDDQTKEMSAGDRLEYHIKHSKPVMDDLHIYLNNQLDGKHVEPNSHLGKAIQYMLNHWSKLTRFLTVAGAPLDNNIAERALKIPIRIRKNAMFHKTEHGAFVAGLLLSLIQTCINEEINPIDYLTILQQNKSQLFKDPRAWLPWNYQETLRALMQAA